MAIGAGAALSPMRWVCLLQRASAAAELRYIGNVTFPVKPMQSATSTHTSPSRAPSSEPLRQAAAASQVRPSPALFISHGSPMLALEPGQTGPALAAWAQAECARQRPSAVLVLSPHWMADCAAVMTHPQPATWHDFGGFPEPLYRLQYPAPGAPALAQQVLQLLQAAGIATRPDAQRPFDHGAWVPLRYLLPKADVPVLQVALPHGYGPAEVYAMGQALAPLRQQGVWLVGSGSMTHNLHEFFSNRPAQDAEAADYVSAFARWVEQRLLAHEREALLNYRELAPQAARAHPTDEHFLPLFFALGAAAWGQSAASQAEPAPPHYLTREVMHRYLAMDALVLQ